MSAQSLILVTKRACPFAERARIVMAHEHIGHELREIDLADRPDWFLAASPLGKVPLLLVDTQPLFESIAIIEYLVEAAAPTPSLRPADPLNRARMRAWMQFDETALVPAFYRMLAANGGPDEAGARAGFARLLEILGDALAPGPNWLLGDQFSLADVTLVTHLLRLDVLTNELQLDPPATPREVSDWIARMRDLPAVATECATRSEMAADLRPYVGGGSTTAAGQAA